MSPRVFDTLIGPKVLADLLLDDISANNPTENVKIIDCQAELGRPNAGYDRYLAAHLPGAVHLSLDDDLAAPPGEGGRHPLPEPETLARRLGALGVGDGDQVVVYDDAGSAFAARAWWCLRWLGHRAVAVLDGGLATWQGPLDQTLPEPEPASFTARPSLTRSIDADALLAALGTTTLVDARSEARHAGLEEPIDPVAGHIPGAYCLPFQGNLNDAGRFLTPDALRARFAGVACPENGSENGPDNTSDLVCYCGSGVTAAHNVLAMRIAGLPEPCLYPGSWSEWIRSEDRPRALTAGDR